MITEKLWAQIGLCGEEGGRMENLGLPAGGAGSGSDSAPPGQQVSLGGGCVGELF